MDLLGAINSSILKAPTKGKKGKDKDGPKKKLSQKQKNELTVKQKIKLDKRSTEMGHLVSKTM